MEKGNWLMIALPQRGRANERTNTRRPLFTRERGHLRKVRGDTYRVRVRRTRPGLCLRQNDGGLLMSVVTTTMKCDMSKEWCEYCSVETICCEEKLCDICKEEDN